MSKEFKLDPKTRAIADRVKPLLAIDSKGSINEVDTKVFEAFVKQDGRTVEEFVEKDNYVSDFIAGAHVAAGELSHDFMKGNKDVSTTSGTFEIGRSRLELSYDRHQRVPNRVLDKESGGFKVDGERDLYGDSNVKLKVRGAQNSKGELKAAREYISGMFTSSFSS